MSTLANDCYGAGAPTMPEESGEDEYPFDRSGLARGRDGVQEFTGTPETYVEVLHDVVRAHGTGTAVVDASGQSLTYAQLWDESLRVAGGLSESGLRSGDRVAVDLPNSLKFVTAFVGTLLAGGVAVPVDQRATASDRQRIVVDADVKAIIDEATPAPRGRPFLRDPEPNAPAQLLYTSGTTGQPKGVLADQRNLACYGEITRRVLSIAEPPEPFRHLVVIPLCHAAGCNCQLLPTLALGGTVILARSTSPADVVDAARRHQADTLLAVPAIYKLLLDREGDALRGLTTLRRAIYGAAPASRSLIEALHQALPGVALGNAYGMTEISNMATFVPDDHSLTHLDSIGVAVPGVDVEVRNCDSAGRGELYMRGPNMARGYWRKPEETEETFGSGWVSSGDIATIDDQGFVYLCDRAKDVINRGGEKIFPAVVEESLRSHPAVDEAVVLPIPDEVMGQKVGAVVVLRAGADVGVSELLAHAAASLPRHAVPERLVVRLTVPRGISGKIKREQLRREIEWPV